MPNQPNIRDLGAGLVGGLGGSASNLFAGPGAKGSAKGKTAKPKLQPTYESALADLLDLLANPPSFDDPEFETYETRVAAAENLVGYLDPRNQPGWVDPNAPIANPDDPNAWRDRQNPNESLIAENQAKLAELGARMDIDQANLTQAASEVGRFLDGLAESRSRANLIQQGQEMRRLYGTSNGKTDFSLADLGAGFAAMAGPMGIDPNAAFVRYPGVMDVNPEADLARLDAGLGVTGAVPTLPANTVTQGDIPTAPALDHDWYKLAPGSGGDMIVNGPAAAPMPTAAPLDIAGMVAGKAVGKPQPVPNPYYTGGGGAALTPDVDAIYRAVDGSEWWGDPAKATGKQYNWGTPVGAR